MYQRESSNALEERFTQGRERLVRWQFEMSSMKSQQRQAMAVRISEPEAIERAVLDQREAARRLLIDAANEAEETMEMKG